MVKTIIDKVTKELYILRLDDDQVEYFEALWPIPEGITYNAYLLVTKEGTILFDGWKGVYADEFINTITKIIDLKDLDYIVVQHTEPDHSGSIPRILEANGYNATIIAHPMVKGLLEAFYGIKDVKFRMVRDGERLEVCGKKLRFIYATWLHWPDTIMTFIEGAKILLSSDVFGGYWIPPSVFDDEEDIIIKYMPFVRKYFATVIGGYRNYVMKCVEKLDSMKIRPKIIAPAHGLVWRRSPERIVSYYISLAKMKPENKITIIYNSMYGFIEEAITCLIDIAESKGLKTVVFKFTDREHDLLSNIVSEAIDSKGLVIGVSTYEAGAFPLIKFVAELLSHKIGNKPVVILSSYGWGGLAGKIIREILEKAGFNIIDVIEYRGRVSKKDLDRAFRALETIISM